MLFVIGSMMIGGGLKGLFDAWAAPQRRPIQEHTPTSRGAYEH